METFELILFLLTAVIASSILDKFLPPLSLPLVQIALGAFATALAYAGLTAADMTTWAGVWQIIKATAANPYCLFLIACNVWSALNDPTTSGLTDSDRAKSYDAPLEK